MSKIDLFSQFNNIDEAMRWCKAMIHIMKSFIADNGACIVLDIDGTLLDEKMLAVPAVVSLAQYAYSVRIPIHVVTARVDVENSRLITIQQLANAGLRLRGSRIWSDKIKTVAIYESLSMRTVREFQNNNFSGYKYRIRCNLPQPVLLNIGDQWDDLIRRGTYAKSHREEILSKTIQILPSKNIYIGQLSDCAWFSIKLPSQDMNYVVPQNVKSNSFR